MNSDPGSAGSLDGKVCVGTGAGGSMGRASALAFAREGASVVGCDVSVDAAAATLEAVRGADGTMVSMQPCELSAPSDCSALVELRWAPSAVSTCCSTSQPHDEGERIFPPRGPLGDGNAFRTIWPPAVIHR
jgi:hypothetical protein